MVTGDNSREVEDGNNRHNSREVVEGGDSLHNNSLHRSNKSMWQEVFLCSSKILATGMTAGTPNRRKLINSKGRVDFHNKSRCKQVFN